MASSQSSGVLNANTLVFNGRQRINALTVFTDGTNDATVSLYDNTTNSGKISVKGLCVGANKVQHFIFENPVFMQDGLYAAVTGTGASFIVFYGG
jgi:hypothetical protein